MKALFIVLPLALLAISFVWACFSFGLNFFKLNPKRSNAKEPEKKQGKLAGKIGSIVLGIVALLILVFVPGSIHQVNAGEVAVVRIWGDAKEVRTPGMPLIFGSAIPMMFMMQRFNKQLLKQKPIQMTGKQWILNL